jgi:gluconate 2-dehydrogenase gamma chain
MPLTAAQRATLAAIVERLIPSDDGPGAREANVAEYVVRSLASDTEHRLPDYAAGLDALDGFAALAAAAQDARLRELEAAGDPFFELVLEHARQGMFGDPAWGGNAGGVGWALVGYPGPRYVWEAHDQDVRPL